MADFRALLSQKTIRDKGIKNSRGAHRFWRPTLLNKSCIQPACPDLLEGVKALWCLRVHSVCVCFHSWSASSSAPLSACNTAFHVAVPRGSFTGPSPAAHPFCTMSPNPAVSLVPVHYTLRSPSCGTPGSKTHRGNGPTSQVNRLLSPPFLMVNWCYHTHAHLDLQPQTRTQLTPGTHRSLGPGIHPGKRFQNPFPPQSSGHHPLS